MTSVISLQFWALQACSIQWNMPLSWAQLTQFTIHISVTWKSWNVSISPALTRRAISQHAMYNYYAPHSRACQKRVWILISIYIYQNSLASAGQQVSWKVCAPPGIHKYHMSKTITAIVLESWSPSNMFHGRQISSSNTILIRKMSTHKPCPCIF